MKRLLLSFLLLLLYALPARATHNRAGEIVYKRIEPFNKVIDGFTVPVFNYSITVIVYTDHGDAVADRCADTVYFGDGQRGIAYRVNGGFALNCGCGSVQCGSLIIQQGNYVVKKNIYTITHEYPGAGTYTISMADPNRNGGVQNIPNSDQQPFYLESVLVISNFMGANSSPIFNCDPIYKACVGKCFYHNPCASDPDGDSLSYKITTSRGYGGATVPGYSFPDTGGGVFSINETKGTITWCTPQLKAEYNIAFIVEEWRKNSSGTFVLIGSVLRDMQVVVEACPNNDPPLVIVPQDTCVEAGSTIIKSIYVSDPNAAQSVSISGFGGAFAVPSNKGFLTPTLGSSSGYTSIFTWNTNCSHIRQQAYQTTFLAADNGTPAALSFYAPYNIRVVPPAVKDLTASPMGSSMKVSWSLSTCSSSLNPLVFYQLYRMDSCVSVNFVPCQTGVPDQSGFKFIGQTAATQNEFIDDNNGNGLVVGRSYSYLVIAKYQDSTETFASAKVCAELTRNIPLITHVDVLSTGENNGSILVKWVRPLVNSPNLDTLVFSGPYRLSLNYRAGAGASVTTVYTVSSPYFLGIPTSFTHSGINTASQRADYQLVFESGTVTVGNSPAASSVYLKTSPSDRRIQLDWSFDTPWNNYKYEIWKKGPTDLQFKKIANTTQQTYLDKDSIVNKFSYCYKVTSYGEYSDFSLPRPLVNNSQESCATAIDNVPPCAPILSLSADCPEGQVQIYWSDIRTVECGEDVVKYRVYYKKTVSDDFQIIYEDSATSLALDGLEYIAGCYAVMAIDSNNNTSPLSSEFCIENCPIFELPNIVTANGDGTNDYFKAVRVRQIPEINLKVYDRWGVLVYQSSDPYFQWDTVSIASGEPVSEGTFFYTCDVFEPRLKGIVKRSLKGYMQVVR